MHFLASIQNRPFVSDREGSGRKIRSNFASAGEEFEDDADRPRENLRGERSVQRRPGSSSTTTQRD